jgi:hypothetical protein
MTLPPRGRHPLLRPCPGPRSLGPGRKAGRQQQPGRPVGLREEAAGNALATAADAAAWTADAALKLASGSSSRLDLGAEPDHGDRAERNEGHQHDQLGDDKRGLRLCRRQRLQERQLLKRLDDRNEDVEIERRSCGADIDPAPCAGEMEGVERGDGDRQQHQRHEADRARGIEAERRQTKSGDVGEDRRAEKQGGPAAERVPGQQPVQDDKAGHDADQADQNVELEQQIGWDPQLSFALISNAQNEAHAHVIP